MTARKKDTDSDEKKDFEKISAKTRQAAETVKELIHSIPGAIEERIALDDHISNISRETEYMLDRIDDVAKAEQRKLLLAYKKFLEQNLDSVNRRLEKL
jgi:hypothetical protein